MKDRSTAISFLPTMEFAVSSVRAKQQAWGLPLLFVLSLYCFLSENYATMKSHLGDKCLGLYLSGGSESNCSWVIPGGFLSVQLRSVHTATQPSQQCGYGNGARSVQLRWTLLVHPHSHGLSGHQEVYCDTSGFVPPKSLQGVVSAAESCPPEI